MGGETKPRLPVFRRRITHFCGNPSKNSRSVSKKLPITHILCILAIILTLLRVNWVAQGPCTNLDGVEPKLYSDKHVHMRERVKTGDVLDENDLIDYVSQDALPVDVLSGNPMFRDGKDPIDELLKEGEKEHEETMNDLDSREITLDIKDAQEFKISEHVDDDEMIGSVENFLPLPARISPINQNVLVNYRTMKCTYFCKLALKQGYRLNRASGASPHRHPPEMLLINYRKYMQYSGLKRTIVNQVGRGSSCIGGGKGKQLSCRQALAEKSGCSFDSLQIQPPQWNIQTPVKCREFFNYAESVEQQIWIAKPGGSFHGKGITIHDDLVSMKKKFGNCERFLPDGVIIQSYISKPALMDGHKFDFRTYLLIASTDPFIVFYHDGFVRKASGIYSTDTASLKDPLKQVTNDVHQQSEDHFFNFAQLQQSLSKHCPDVFGPDFMDNKFIPHAMRVSNYLFHSASNRSKGFISTPGRFQVFALDWMLDAEGGMHLLEANGNPLVTDYPNIGLTPKLWESMIRLEKYLHTAPEYLLDSDTQSRLSVADGYRFENWRLVYNQVEAEAKKVEYEACKFNKYEEQQHPLFSYVL